MEIIEIADGMEDRISKLEKGRAELKERSMAKAQAIGDYRKQRAKVLMQLRNGVAFVLDGVEIVDPPTTLCESMARGLCFKEKIAEELATAQYKSAVVGMSALEAELNGLQSMNRHLESK